MISAHPHLGRRLALAATTMLAGAALAGCDMNVSLDGPLLTKDDLAGDATTVSRDLDGFTTVELEGSAFVEIVQSDDFSVDITADSALMEHIDTTVVGTTLHIDQEYSLLGASAPVEVLIGLPDLEGLSLLGSGDGYIHAIDADTLTVKIAGSGDVLVEADPSTLTLDIAGSGDARLRGTVDEVTMAIAGSGDIEGSDLTAAHARIDIAGSGDVGLRVRETLDIAIAGSGNVLYWGSPRVTTDVAGSGDIAQVAP